MEAGFCTWAEVAAWDGEWTRGDIALFLPVAVERLEARKQITFEATLGAIGSLFSKEGVKDFIAGLAKTHEQIRAEQRRQRGGSEADEKVVRQAAAARKLRKGFAAFAGKGRR